MAGAVFGEVHVSLFVAGAAFREMWNDSRSAKFCIFNTKPGDAFVQVFLVIGTFGFFKAICLGFVICSVFLDLGPCTPHPGG